ncbi:hypothetical protein I3271_09245 [Photobacterium leiognathi]|uniref:hypothetical protein n=1 Tax=Photobacterium leiognathi TaxID=553611 RepID=UPI001EE04691|nr:hypothetical protein [Photobacterium leiognathi]MCG3884873.1 hypothetical protein [Photobacterium leiognathi]
MKRKIRRYRKLSTGRPKKLIDIRTFRDAWRYRDYPFLINGEITCVTGNQWLWWHCNDEYKQLSTLNGESLGYLKGDVIRSRKCYSGWFYYWGMYLADSPSALGKRVKVFAVVEVY